LTQPGQIKSPSQFVWYHSHSDAVYIVAGQGMVEEELVEVAPGVNFELDATGE
jgi:hypothetical protein